MEAEEEATEQPSQLEEEEVEEGVLEPVDKGSVQAMVEEVTEATLQKESVEKTPEVQVTDPPNEYELQREKNIAENKIRMDELIAEKCGSTVAEMLQRQKTNKGKGSKSVANTLPSVVNPLLSLTQPRQSSIQPKSHTSDFAVNGATSAPGTAEVLQRTTPAEKPGVPEMPG